MNKLAKLPSKIADNNFALMVVSIIAAFIVWFIFTIFYNPVQTRSFKNVPINFDTSGTAVESLGMDVVNCNVESVSVVISGKSVDISSVYASDINISPSLSGITEAGTYEVPLVATSSSLLSGYEVVSISPEKVTVTFDEIITHTFDVTAEAVGCTAAGDLIVETPAMTEAATTTLNVSGAKSDIERIARVVARGQVNKELTETASFDADIILLDEAGKEIDSRFMNLGFRTANITVNISKMKTVPVKPVFNNAPSGLDFKYTLSEKNVTIIGKPEVVDSISSVELAPISCGEITDDNNVFELAPSLPGGVRLYDESQNKITVSVNTSSFKTTTVKVNKIEYVGLSSGINTKLKSAQSVTVMGSKSDISAIKASDITLVVDMSGKTASDGTVSVNATPKINDRLTSVWVVTLNKTYTVTVTLS